MFEFSGVLISSQGMLKIVLHPPSCVHVQHTG